MVFPWFSHGLPEGNTSNARYVRQEMCAVRSRLEALEKLEVGSGQGFFFVRDFGHEKWWYHNMWYLWYLWYIYIYSQKWFHYRFTIKNGRSTLANGRFHYVSLTGAPYINLKSGSSGVKNRGLTYGTFSFKSDLTRKRCLEFDGPMGSPLSQISISWGYFLRCIINTIWRDSLGYIMDMDIYIYTYMHAYIYRHTWSMWFLDS